MRILIVGASGYIGARLVALLQAAGHDLVLMSRDARPLVERFPGARVVPRTCSNRPPCQRPSTGSRWPTTSRTR